MARVGDVVQALRGAQAIIVVPPFASLEWPALGPHVLQAVASAAGHDVRVLYANLLFAERIGVARYQRISQACRPERAADRVFCHHAFPELPALGRSATSIAGSVLKEDLRQAHGTAGTFCRELGEALALSEVPIVGCTTTFDQTLSALALLRHLKNVAPRVTTVLGGANCEGTMATALARSAPMVDVIFRGESEVSFLDFLRARSRHELGGTRIITGRPCQALGDLPCPDYSDYFSIRALCSMELPRPSLSYETSRGCWWGAKHHCTFCGLNGEELAFRSKPAEVVLADLANLRQRHGDHRICMTDNIMPYAYHRSLLPQLAKLNPPPTLFYEQKANLSWEQVCGLAAAGVTTIQPGIESLSTRLLQLMKKGVTAAQNIALLRYALMCGITPQWNLLYGLPGDNGEDYRQMLQLISRLTHLPPPAGVSSVSIDRFSPYFENPVAFGITELRPLDGHCDVWPVDAAVDALAYHFKGLYPSESASDPTLRQEMESAVHEWRSNWLEPRRIPRVCILPMGSRGLLYFDTRNPDVTVKERITEAQARAALWGRSDADALAWAQSRGCCLMVDGQWVPVATSDIELMDELNSSAQRVDNDCGV